MKGNKLLQIGLLALSLSAFGLAQAGGPPTLPPAVEEAVQSASLIAIVDADGNTLWTSRSGIPLSEVTIPEGAVFVVYDAEGNPALELPLIVGPNGRPLVELPDGGLLPPGKLVREVAGPANGAMDGSGQMHRHQNSAGTPAGPAHHQGRHRHSKRP